MMEFKKEYSRNIERFLQYAEMRMYKKIKDVSFKCFFTKDRLTLEEAKTKELKTILPGTEWGVKWEYGFFFTTIEIPQGFDGQRIVFKAPLGEGLVWVNGKIYGALDKEHKEITLTRSAKTGEKFEVVFEVYAGHGPEREKIICLPGDDCKEFAEDITQKVVEKGEFGVFFDELYMLLMDVKALYELMKGMIDKKSLRYKMLSVGLKKFCSIVDLEAEDDELMLQVMEARKLLKPLLEAKNGDTVPTIYAVGHSHLDLEWLWAVNETRRKTARTVGNQIRLIDEYPEYKYVQSQPWIMNTIKNEYPELYNEFKDAVKKGNIFPEGATWVEMDTNIPSGESLIRQFIFGKRFFKDEFDYNCEILWIPDVFGVSASLPQIMKGCGVKYIYHSKVCWSYNLETPIPKGTNLWKGIDGTEVILYSNSAYAMPLSVECNNWLWNEAGNTENVPDIMIPYGHGDGGGGATRNHLEYAIRQKNLEGTAKVKMSDPLSFFKDVESKYEINSTFEGELWYAEHKATYTTQAKLKKLNRKSEAALREAEFWTTLLGNESKKDKTDALWEKVLFNQFHDIIPGTSIERVCKNAEKSYDEVISQANIITENAVDFILDKEKEYITVFNSLSWSRMVEIELPDGYNGLEDETGGKIDTYISEGKVYATVLTPACGCKSFALKKDAVLECESEDDALVLENKFLRAEFNTDGELISMCDKDGQEYITTPSNRFKLYRNHPVMFDAWDIDADYKEKEVEIKSKTTVRIVSKSKHKTVLLIKKELLNSVIEQKVILTENCKALKFETKVDWKETHKLLKVDFNTNIHTNELVSETQFGYIRRANHKNFPQDAAQYEKVQHKWSALMEGGRGFAVLNDCKYGIGAEEGIISLTLLTSAMAPMIDADKGVHTFTYSLYPVNSSLENSSIVQEAYELNHPAMIRKGFVSTKTLFDVSASNIILDTVKTAEDGCGDIVVRLYESANRRTKCTLKCNFDIKSVAKTNMLEENGEIVNGPESSIDLAFEAFEVVTLKIQR